MATKKQVDDSVANVASGNAKSGDAERTARQARVAGSAGSAARAAQKEAGKDKSKSWGGW